MNKQEKDIVLRGLKQILEWYETETGDIYFSEGVGMYFGICEMVEDLAPRKRDIVTKYLEKNLPRKVSRWYCWSVYSKRGRINWLKKHIKILET